MTTQILVPLDGSEKAYDALEYAIEHFPDAELTVLHVLGLDAAAVAEGTVIVMDEGIRQAAADRAESIFEQAQDRATETGYDGELHTVTAEGNPKNVIVEHADSVDTVVMGTFGRVGVGQKLLGSVAEAVVRRSSVPVVVVK